MFCCLNTQRNARRRFIMYLHIGMNTAVLLDDIILVSDIDNVTTEKPSIEFLNKMQAQNKLVETYDDFPKSFVLCSERTNKRRNKKNEKLYISQINSRTIISRLNEI